jgi:hypothetical protein
MHVWRDLIPASSAEGGNDLIESIAIDNNKFRAKAQSRKEKCSNSHSAVCSLDA